MRKQDVSSEQVKEPEGLFAGTIDRGLLQGPVKKAQSAYIAQFNEIAATSPVFANEWLQCTEGMKTTPVVINTGPREIRANELDTLLHITHDNREEAQRFSEELTNVIKLCDVKRDEVATIEKGDKGPILVQKNEKRQVVHNQFFPTPVVHGYSLGVLMENRKFADEALDKLAGLNDTEVVIKGERYQITAKELRDIISGDNKSMAYENIKKIRAMQNPEVHPAVDLDAVLKLYDKKSEIEGQINDLNTAHQRPHHKKMETLSKKDILTEIERFIDPQKLKDAMPKSQTMQKLTSTSARIQIMLKQASESAKSKIVDNYNQLATHQASSNASGVLVCQLESARLNGVVKGISDIRTHLKLHPFELRTNLKDSKRVSVRLSTTEDDSKSSVKASDATPSVSRRTSTSSEADFKWEDTHRDSFDAGNSNTAASASQSRHRLSSRPPSSQQQTGPASAGERPKVSWAVSRSQAAEQVKADNTSTDQQDNSRSRSPSFSSNK